MTAFVLVSGPFTGGWVWRDVVARLRAAGAEAYAVTLSGMEPGVEPEPGSVRAAEVDLEAHVADVVRVVDGIGAGAGDVVLVGHDYGIHPVLGAVGRRPGRCGRVVFLDTGMPADGDPATASLPAAAATEPVDGLVPPPAGEEWERWGSTAGLSAEARERLDRLAVPQPVRTLTRPLRLTGRPFDRPMTGVLCTASGSGISMVEMLVASGPPRFRVLADPRVGFFELDTGHWPMLSAPGPLAEVLLRAAADEGIRLSVPGPAGDRPDDAGAFLLDVPERPRERRGRVDLHLPEAEGPRPAVLFVHGGPVSPEQRPTPRDSPAFLGYGRHVAGLGAVGVTLDHRLYGLADYPRAAEDVAGAVELVRADPRVDGERIALWFFSGGGLLAADWLAAPPSWLRCVALSYPVLAPPPDWRAVPARFHPVRAVGASSPPVVLTRAGLEHPVFQATVDAFRTAADRAGATVDLVDVPLAHHGFETVDHTEETRTAVVRAVRSVLRHVAG
ncbi:alpha/beta fold hydrolase [Streptomyces sp. NPDC012769]|uniref:alpha/beta hydrolase n=1 Tax=Streptomyces sp. NPDC012769 TaxID=3364848 RepID=UPI003691AC83